MADIILQSGQAETVWALINTGGVTGKVVGLAIAGSPILSVLKRAVRWRGQAYEIPEWEQQEIHNFDDVDGFVQTREEAEHR